MKSSSSCVLHLIDTSSCGQLVLFIVSCPAGSVGVCFFRLFCVWFAVCRKEFI
uniref:Uncharacterized protein n=1 Tax=Anguilla anguilla TaxID=7936 RepID=A0A0E9S1Z4_ANGAN